MLKTATLIKQITSCIYFHYVKTFTVLIIPMLLYQCE